MPYGTQHPPGTDLERKGAWGDPAHYNANVDAYRQSSPHLEALKKELAARKAILDQEKTGLPGLAWVDLTTDSPKKGGEMIKNEGQPPFLNQFSDDPGHLVRRRRLGEPFFS